MKKSFIIFFIVLLVNHLVGFSQKVYEDHFGRTGLDVAYATAATSDGGYIITGLTKSLGEPNGDIIVVKTSAQWDTLWTLVYGGPLLEGGNGVIQTSDGGYMVTGHTQDFGAIDCDAYLMKLDKNGNRQWFTHYGGIHDDIGSSVLQLPDGGYFIAGITESFGNTDSSVRRHDYFIRTNSNGDALWIKYYAGKGQEYSLSAALMNDGNFLTVGWSTSYGNGEHDAQMMCLNGTGDTVWTRLRKCAGDSKFFQVLPTLDGGYILAGLTTQTQTCRSQGLAVKLDAYGNEQWEKVYGDTVTGILLHGVAQLPNGDLLFAGSDSIHTPVLTVNIYFLKTDMYGNKIFDTLYGGIGSDANAIAAQGNNSFLIAGATQKYGDNQGDLYYIGFDNTILGIPNTTTQPLKVFPNPVKDLSWIILPSPESFTSVRLEVLNTSGKLIYSMENMSAKDIVINRNGLPVGEYLYKVSCEDGKVYKGKFVVE